MIKKNNKERKKKKEQNFKKANIVDLGYKPPQGRIVWIGVTNNDDKRIVHCGTTHEGLKKALLRGKEFDEFKVVDLKTDNVITIDDIEKFMEKWKENYFNPKWGYKKLSKLFQ